MIFPDPCPAIAAVSVALMGITGAMTLDVFAKRRVSFLPIPSYCLAYICAPAGYFGMLASGLILAGALVVLLEGSLTRSRYPLREAAMSAAAPLGTVLFPADPPAALIVAGFVAALAGAAAEARLGWVEACKVFVTLSLSYGAMALTLPVFMSTMVFVPDIGGLPVAVTLVSLTVIIWRRQRATEINRARMDRLQRLSLLSDRLLSSENVAEYIGGLVEFLPHGVSADEIRIVSRIPEGEGWIAWDADRVRTIEDGEIDPPTGKSPALRHTDGGVLMSLDPQCELLLECGGACSEALESLDPDTRRSLGHVLFHTWQVMGHSTHQEEAFLAAAMMLARLADAKDTYTHGHSLRVARIATSLGEMFGLEGDSLRLLRVSALLHDIGKIAIPEEILTKRGLLTREERRIIERHPEEGADIVSNLTGYEEVSRIVRSHHERLDGSGYPDGLKGTGIPFMARLVAVADTFDAITSTRSYHSDTDFRTALDTITVGSGQQFDSRVVSMLRRALRDVPEGGASPW